jgi:hypothetical protein
MGDIHNLHHPEDERQTSPQQEKERREGDAVKTLVHPEFHMTSSRCTPVCALFFSFIRRGCAPCRDPQPGPHILVDSFRMVKPFGDGPSETRRGFEQEAETNAWVQSLWGTP